MEENHANSFRLWLESERGMKEKSARDVVSRLRRALRYADTPEDKPLNEMILSMSHNEEYRTLSIFVRSQLRQAVTLHNDFVKSQ